MGEIIIGGVVTIGARDEEIEVGIGIEVSREEIVEMEGVFSCGTTKCGDVGVVWSSSEVERIGEIEVEIEPDTSISTEGVLVVAERI